MLFLDPSYTVSYLTPFEIAFSFVYLALASVIVGACIGLISALMFKNLRVLAGNSVHETAMVFIFGNLAYLGAEWFGLSGIISLLASGVVMAHYTYYSLSP